jgi:two-component system sensor histidine kinase TtrS
MKPEIPPLQRICKLIFAAVLPFVIGGVCLAEESKEAFRPLVLVSNEFSMPGLGMSIADATFRAVQKAVAPHPLIVRNLKTVDEIDEAIRKNEADFAVVGAAVYWRHLNRGFRDIATLVTPEQPDPDHAVGALLVTKENAPFTTLEDLRGTTLGANHPIGFQGYLTLKKELVDRGYDPEKFFRKVIFYGLDPIKRLEALQRGEVDAVSLNVCYLERHIENRNSLLQGLKPVGTKPNESTCAASTDLYPNWSFLIAPNLDNRILVKVANALYTMPENIDGQKWTIASDFRAADNLYKTLKTGPYEYLSRWTLERFWHEYGLWVLLALLSVAFLIFHSYRTQQLVNKRTAELRCALHEQKRLREYSEKITREQEESRRMLTISQISSMVAHELSQPLSSIELYVRGLKVLIGKKVAAGDQNLMNKAADNILERSRAAADIVREVREYAQSRDAAMAEVDLGEIIRKTVSSLVSSGKAEKGTFRLRGLEEKYPVAGRSLELEIALTNILKNSLEAAEGCKAKIDIAAGRRGDKVFINITDNHKRLSDEDFERIVRPLRSVKDGGLGLGLSIVRGIVENHLGLIEFERLEKGLRVRLSFPLSLRNDHE